VALQVAVEILVLSDRDEIHNVSPFFDDICDEPLIILGLEFFHPDLTQRPALPISPMRILEDLRLHFVEPMNNCRREALTILIVAWSGESGIWQLPPPPRDRLSKACLDLGRPRQDLFDESERQIRIVFCDHGQLDVPACLLAEGSMLSFRPRGKSALQCLAHA